MTKFTIAALCALALSACAHNRPPPAAEAPPAHQAEAAPPPAEAAPSAPTPSGRLSMSLPEGWAQVPAERVPEGMTGAVMNPSLRAVVMVLFGPVAENATHEAGLLRTQLEGGGWTCTPVTASADGTTASFTLSQGTMRGKIVVRALGAGGRMSVVLMGQWPSASDAAATAGIDAIAASASFE